MDILIRFYFEIVRKDVEREHEKDIITVQEKREACTYTQDAV